jgi:non-heme Fe2+,alpha-ketoglutarate-dependent halogenase
MNKLLSDVEQKFLADNGYLEPFEGVWEEKELDNIREMLLVHMRNKADKHPLYGRYSTRDWHLVYPEITRLLSHPKILGQLKSVMGENLIMWRSVVFYKPPGGESIGWHQEFGPFSGEDIGNNKVSLVPTHLENINENKLLQYLPDSLKMQKTEPAPDQSDFWNMTLWIALSDVDEDMGPLQFIKGSHKVRYPIRMEPMTKSDFWQSPFANISNKSELVTACCNSSLMLDADTSKFLDGIELDKYSFSDLKKLVLSKLDALKGSTTVVDEIKDDQVFPYPMKKGNYLIFSERTMHRSSANTSDKERIAINFRITPASTLVYPSRLRGDFIDGFNLDVTNHKCILLCGKNLNPDNCVETLES